MKELTKLMEEYCYTVTAEDNNTTTFCNEKYVAYAQKAHEGYMLTLLPISYKEEVEKEYYKEFRLSSITLALFVYTNSKYYEPAVLFNHDFYLFEIEYHLDRLSRE